MTTKREAQKARMQAAMWLANVKDARRNVSGGV
jgi:hypothetical protein